MATLCVRIAPAAGIRAADRQPAEDVALNAECSHPGDGQHQRGAKPGCLLQGDFAISEDSGAKVEQIHRLAAPSPASRTVFTALRGQDLAPGFCFNFDYLIVSMTT